MRGSTEVKCGTEMLISACIPIVRCCLRLQISDSEKIVAHLLPPNVTRLREIHEDNGLDEDNVPVDEDIEHLDIVYKVEVLLIIHKLWIHS